MPALHVNAKRVFRIIRRPGVAAGIAILVVLSFLFCLGCKKEAPKAVDYSATNEVGILLGHKNFEYGLRQTKNHHDGTNTAEIINGMECRHVRRVPPKEAYFYFIIDPTFKQSKPSNVVVTVDYFGATQGAFDVQYDGKDSRKAMDGMYTPSKTQVMQTRTLAWEQATFELKNARFDNSQADNADFRIRVKAPELFIRRVTVRRLDQDGGSH